MTLYRVMGINPDTDEHHEEQRGLTTFEEATEVSLHYRRLYDCDFYVEPYEETDEQQKLERTYNENAVDGWEDIYPDRDY